MKYSGDPVAITIRAVQADDKARIAKAFRALEPRSIYLRFFFRKKELGNEELRRLTEPDRAREVVLVATIGSGDEEIIVGLGRYARDGGSASIAFTVEEDYQGRGIATRLLQHLVRIAREMGVSRFEADVLAENTAMLTVFRHSKLPMTQSAKEGIVHVTLLLGEGAEQ